MLTQNLRYYQQNAASIHTNSKEEKNGKRAGLQESSV